MASESFRITRGSIRGWWWWRSILSTPSALSIFFLPVSFLHWRLIFIAELSEYEGDSPEVKIVLWLPTLAALPACNRRIYSYYCVEYDAWWGRPYSGKTGFIIYLQIWVWACVGGLTLWWCEMGSWEGLWLSCLTFTAYLNEYYGVHFMAVNNITKVMHRGKLREAWIAKLWATLWGDRHLALYWNLESRWENDSKYFSCGCQLLWHWKNQGSQSRGCFGWFRVCSVFLMQ